MYNSFVFSGLFGELVGFCDVCASCGFFDYFILCASSTIQREIIVLK